MFGASIPVYVAEFPCNLRCRLENFGSLDETLLDSHFDIILQNSLHSLDNQGGSHFHKFVMDFTDGLVRADKTLLPHHDITGIHSVINHESRDSGGFFTVDHCPVDRGGSPVLREKGCMKVESTKLRNLPYNLRKHPEGHDNEKVRFPCL